MRVVLFCQLSGQLIESDGQPNPLISFLNRQNTYLLSPDTAIAWVENEELAASIVLKEKIFLKDSFFATYSFGENVTSRYLEILISDERYEASITEAVKKVYLQGDVLVSFKKLAILIRYSSVLMAIDGYQLLTEVFKSIEGVKSIGIVAMSSHCLLECRWLGNITIGQIDQDQQSLKGLVEDKLHLCKLQPMIIDVRHVKSLPTPMDANRPDIGAGYENLHRNIKFTATPTGSFEDRIVIICPTHRDAQALRDCGTIELAGGTIVIAKFVRDDNFKNEELMSNEKRNMGLLTSPPAAIQGFLEPIYPPIKESSLLEQDEEKMRKMGTTEVADIAVEKTKLVLDLTCYAIANYFKVLVKWGVEAYSILGVVGENKGEEVEENDTLPLWGEYPEGEEQTDRELSSLTVLLDNKAKNYCLHISSDCTTVAAERMKRIERLAALTISMRETAAMIDWCPQHREALNESNMLKNLLNKTKATVLFHESKDKVISADVVALTKEDRVIVFQFLSDLIPRQAEWSVPADCVTEYTTADWVELRRNYAVKLDIKGGYKRIVKGLCSAQKGTKSLRVWGFEPSMDLALKFILAAAPAATRQCINFGGSPGVEYRKYLTSEPSRVVKCSLGCFRDSSDQEIDFDNGCHINDGNDGWGAAVRDKKSFYGHYIFLDREAGMLYQAFEKEFHAFLLQSFHVSVRDSQSTMSEIIPTGGLFDINSKLPMNRGVMLGAKFPSPLQSQHRTPALKIEFCGPSKKEVYSVRAYFERISFSNLSRQQIYFPRYDATRYRELYDQKTKHEANISMIRRGQANAFQPSNMYDKDLYNIMDREKRGEMKGLKKNSDSPNWKTTERDPFNFAGDTVPDPLLSVGFVNIRIRPPLHSRGIRRMTFPADVTITICSPVNTEAQVADYNTLSEHFSAMDTHYITASVEIPLPSNLAKQITMRTTRDEFIIKHGLVSLRWEENSLRRDGSNTYPSLSCGSMDDISTSSGGLDTFSRARSASDSRRDEGPQLGVAKLWATKPKTMKNALDTLCSGEGVVISVSLGDNFGGGVNDIDGTAYPPLSLSDILPSTVTEGKYAATYSPQITSMKSPAVFSEKKSSPHLFTFAASATVDNMHASKSKSIELLPILMGTIDTAQGLRDFNFTETQAPKTSPRFDPYSAFSPFSMNSVGTPQTHPLVTPDLFSHSSHRSVSPPNFMSPKPLDIGSYPQYQNSMYSSAKNFPKQTQGVADTYKHLQQQRINPQYSSHSEKQTILQPIALRLSVPQFEQSSYPPIPSNYIRSPNHPPPTSFFPSNSNFASGSIQERFSVSPKPASYLFEEPSSRIKAAPGLTLPTDWDHLFAKVESRTPPPSYIPRELTPPPASFSGQEHQPSTSFALFSPQSISEKGFSFSGFAPTPSNLSTAVSPNSAFTPVRDRGLPATRLRKDNYGQEFGGLLTSSPQNLLSTPARSSLYPDPQDRGIGALAGFSDSCSLNTEPIGLESCITNYQRHIDASPFAPPIFDANQYVQNSQQMFQPYRPQQVKPQHVIEDRVVVHWPHPSFRFMFLGDPLKYQLSDLLHKIRSRGIRISTPFKEKNNVTDCLLIEGTHQSVAIAGTQIDAYFRSVLHQVRGVQMILTETQRENLTSADLARVKEIQGSSGAHIILDPQLDDLSESISCFDIRLPFTDLPLRATSVGSNHDCAFAGEETNIGPSGDIIPLIAVRVVSASGHKIDISVIPNKLSKVACGESSWGVNSLITLIDSSAAAEFNQEERDKIDSSGILVNCDSATGRTVIRVWPKCAVQRHRSRSMIEIPEASGFSSGDSRARSNSASGPPMLDHDAESQARALVGAVSKGLAAAEAWRLTRVALIAPIGNVFFFALSADLIRTITVEAAVTFLKGTHLSSLQKVVLVDLTPANGDHLPGLDPLSGSKKVPHSPFSRVVDSQSGKCDTSSQSAPSMSSSETALLPACGNQMALMLILLLEQANLPPKNRNMQNDSFNGYREDFHRDVRGEIRRRESFTMPSPAIHLIACNVPLPYSLSAEAICPAVLLAQQQQQQQQRRARVAAVRGESYSGLGFDSYLPQQVSQHHDDFGGEGPCIIVLKGLPVGIVRAIRAIKHIVANKFSSH